MILAVAPNPSLDRTLVVDSLLPGSIHRPSLVTETAGGKGLNVARVVAALGAQVTALALLGGHIGERVRDLLTADGVACVTTAATGETRICTSVSDASAGNLTEFYERAPMVAEPEWISFICAYAAALGDVQPSWVTLSGSLPPGAPEDAMRRLVQSAHDAGSRVAVDTHGEALQQAIASGPDVVKVNVAEATELLGRAPASGRPDAAWLRALDEVVAGLVVVTLGEDGCVARTGDRSWIHARLDELGSYPVGSGDAFLAGLVTALSQDLSLEDCLRLATAAGAANAAVPGAGVIEARTVDAFRPRVSVAPLRAV